MSKDRRILALCRTDAGWRWDLLHSARRSLTSARALAEILAQRTLESSPESEAATEAARAIERLLAMFGQRERRKPRRRFRGNDQRQLPVGDRI